MIFRKILYCLSTLLVCLLPLSGFSLTKKDELKIREVQKEYPKWYQTFEKDMEKLAEVTKEKVLTEDDISSLFKDSVEPRSKMVRLLLAMRDGDAIVSRPHEPSALSMAAILLILLKEAKPVGLGGLAPSSDGTVVYIKLKAEAAENPYAQNKPPESGKLVRNVYPFLVFKKINGKLVLSSLSKEFNVILDNLHTMQLI